MGFVKAAYQLKYPYCTIYNDYLYNILNISVTSTIVLIIYYSIFTNMQKKSLFPWTDVNGQKKSTYRCKYSWCGRRDLNPHAVRRQILSLVRLPIPPLPRTDWNYNTTYYIWRQSFFVIFIRLHHIYRINNFKMSMYLSTLKFQESKKEMVQTPNPGARTISLFRMMMNKCMPYIYQ